jgi:hypothetical protein
VASLIMEVPFAVEAEFDHPRARYRRTSVTVHGFLNHHGAIPGNTTQVSTSTLTLPLHLSWSCLVFAILNTTLVDIACGDHECCGAQNIW